MPILSILTIPVSVCESRASHLCRSYRSCRSTILRWVLLVGGLFGTLASVNRAETPANATPTQSADVATQSAAAENQTRMAKRFAAFEAQMSGSSLIGSFTKQQREQAADGDAEQPLTEERYDIHSVKKVDRGDYWIIQARIRYGDLDVTLPIPVQVKWAGETPVIVLENATLPGLGTFDAHVLIRDRQYAGTWRHDQQGGHLFGRIERTVAPPTDQENDRNHLEGEG